MAEETKPEVAPVAPATTTTAEEVVVPEAEKAEVAEKEVSPPTAEEKPAVAEEAEKKIAQQVSFKEETNVAAELPEYQRKALEDLKKLISEACAKREFSAPPHPPIKEEEKKEEEEQTSTTAEEEKKPSEEVAPVTTTAAVEPPTAASVVAADETAEDEEKTVEAIKETIVEVSTPEATPVAEPEEVSIWGISLLADERSDVILLKFLRARDFKVKEAFTMIRNTVRWRKEYGVDELVDQDLGGDFEKVYFTHGSDKEGRPVVYNVFGEFQNKELYQNTFADAEKRTNFEKSLIVFIEKFIRNFDFSPKGVNTFVLVNDLNNFPGFGSGKKDAKQSIDMFLAILQDNYPEFVAKQVCINTSWWYVAYYWIYLTVFTPRSKSKFVFASPSKTPETLFKYISPEQVPIQYGGHSKIGESEFSSADPVTEVTIKPGSKHPIEFALAEGNELKWELRVIGWDVNYGAEFMPAKEGGYTLNIAKPKKVAPTDEPVISDTFKVTEAGKVVITIDNQSSKKKKLLYRSKVKISE